MAVTIKGLDRLAKRAIEAETVLVRRVQRSAIHNGDIVAWGQFLDDPRRVRQFGIYGTSAAVRILAGAGHTENSPLISRALRALPEVEPRDTTEDLYDATDLSITFKVASLVEAAQPQRERFEKVEPIETRLISQVIDNRGWGNYSDHTDQDDAPRLLPTAHAMLALRRSRSFRASPMCEKILAWFCQEAIRGHPLPVHEAALALQVLIEYEGEGTHVDVYRTARQDLLSQLTKWATTNRGQMLTETTANHYWSVNDGIQHNQYVFYVTDILGALTLLRAGNPAPARRRVLGIVDKLSKMIITNDGFRSTTSRRVSSVDQLWAWLLLQEFGRRHQARPKILLPPAAYYISATPVRRVVATLSMVTAGAVGTLVTFGPEVHVALRVMGGVIAAVILGLLASLLVVWLRGD
ncbi:hypothetical protein [Phytohabitans aurantiacus]|uniref:Uncharacterized protein n=1 Tax=Phytohabitans aurantiacus TaxID=3016789 RepID=A0ABQ5QMY4_9ACTN|nr:hypothetical protein [Phytohabitans aurantiacus]GLH95599.1 hypothetical protein Pa4123_08710 [Phytohabitans aurantiacus]